MSFCAGGYQIGHGIVDAVWTGGRPIVGFEPVPLEGIPEGQARHIGDAHVLHGNADGEEHHMPVFLVEVIHMHPGRQLQAAKHQNHAQEGMRNSLETGRCSPPPSR
jgi:hypothetical protein